MRITHKIAEKAAEEIKQLFLSKTRTMADAYERMPGDLSVAISCKWKPTDEQEAIGADIGIAFKVDECRQKQTYKFTESEFGPLFDRANMTGLKKILFRDFGNLSQDLELASRARKREEAKQKSEAKTNGEAHEGAEKTTAQGEASEKKTGTYGEAKDQAQDGKKGTDPTELRGYAPQKLWDSFTRTLMEAGIKEESILRECRNYVHVAAKATDCTVREVLNDAIEKWEPFLRGFNAYTAEQDGRGKAPDQAPCIGCEYHKGMPNPKKGCRVAGVPGKCIRDGGPCYRTKEWLEAKKPAKKTKPKAKPQAAPKKKGMSYDV